MLALVYSGNLVVIRVLPMTGLARLYYRFRTVLECSLVECFVTDFVTDQVVAAVVVDFVVSLLIAVAK